MSDHTTWGAIYDAANRALRDIPDTRGLPAVIASEAVRDIQQIPQCPALPVNGDPE